MMKAEFKRVPAIDNCFSIPGLLAQSKVPLGFSDIAGALTYKEIPFLILPTHSQIWESLKKGEKINFILGPICYALSRVSPWMWRNISGIRAFVIPLNLNRE